MKADTLFGKLAKSSMHLSTGLFLSLGLVAILVMTNFRAIMLLLGGEEEKAQAHFTRIIENVREQETFLQAIADKMATPTAEMLIGPGILKPTLQFNDADQQIFEVSEGAFSLPFTVVLPPDQPEGSLAVLTSMGWHLTNYYSRFWAQSNYLSPQAFAFSPETSASIAVPAIGKFRNENFLSRQNYKTRLQQIAQQIAVQPKISTDRKVRWSRAFDSSQETTWNGRVLAYVIGDLLKGPVRANSDMEHLVVATVLDTQRLSGAASNLDLPFHGRFTLIAPDGDALTGHLSVPVQESGLFFARTGLAISLMDNSINGQNWKAQYFVDYASFFRWALFPLLRLLTVSVLLFFAFRWLYRIYRIRVVIPANTAQAQLVESEAFNQSVIESGPAALLAIRLADGAIVIENERAQNSRSVCEALVETLRGPTTTLEGEACMVLQQRYYLVNCSTARYQDQEVILCAFSDITEHQEFAVALREAKRLAEKANEAKTIFLATMSHEIRTPLYGVLGTLELLGLTFLGKRQLEYLQTIRVSSSTVLQIISDVLDVAKIESGQMKLDSVNFCPLELAENALSAHVANARAKGLQIYACIDPTIPDVLCGDEVRTAQIINNFLSNAIKFTHIGRVVLRCRVLNDDEKETTLEFQIADTGIGITAEQQLHLFEPFYQARTSNLISGTGLGLSICSRFTDLMAGEMSVISEPGLGSSFSVRLTFSKPDETGGNNPQIDLSGTEVYVRAPVREVADNVCGWLSRWGGRATAITDKAQEWQKNALLVDMFGLGELPFQWNGQTIDCTSDGPRVVERTDNGLWVSAHFIRAIAVGVMIEKTNQSDLPPQDLGTSLSKLNLDVLVAEDNLINQSILKEQLEALGCNVLLAGNGLQALKLWEQERFDVVLSDVNMPVLSGYELARAIRESDSELPIIGITANAMRDEGERCLAAGMNAWLVKPLSLADLQKVLMSFKGDVVPDMTPLADVRESTGVVVLSNAMRGLFHSTMKADMATLHSALDEGRAEELAQVLHSVSGALAVVRADQLSSSFGLLEYKVREQILNTSLKTEIEQALAALEALLDSL
ncbi:response regulator [Pseudomonas azerbaijanoccidentalis]